MAAHRSRRHVLYGVVAGVLVLALLFMLWRHTPLSLSPSAVARWARGFGDEPWAPLAIVLAYLPASVVMFPRPLISMAAVVAFGTWLGVTCALGGILLAALASYALGRLVSLRTLRRVAGRRVFRVSRMLRRGGVAAVTTLRLVPVAPFVVFNMVAGAARVRVLDFTAGTALGMAPGLTGAAIVGAGLREALDAPAEVDWRLIAALAAVALLASVALREAMRRAP